MGDWSHVEFRNFRGGGGEGMTEPKRKWPKWSTVYAAIAWAAPLWGRFVDPIQTDARAAGWIAVGAFLMAHAAYRRIGERS